MELEVVLRCSGCVKTMWLLCRTAPPVWPVYGTNMSLENGSNVLQQHCSKPLNRQ